MTTLSLVAAMAYTYIAATQDNVTLVLVAIIGAFASILNTWMLTRDRYERRHHQKEVRDAVKEGGLVAMVPEQIMKDMEEKSP